MAYKTNELAVALARLEWKIDAILDNIDKATKEQTKTEVELLRREVLRMQDVNDEPRVRVKKEKGDGVQTKQNVETQIEADV